ncbi:MULTISPECIES: Acg family FMN-binding oxidoreductase [unclassified Bradyrhizobium]|uniref:Acg family FMN-binding oxidoreductase n=1 Tax=unclassified Bradyrhizobium TaxID=2631580 RepID=UPI0028EEF05C|nr:MULTISPECIES: nitroreductase family protein [unclassified Bradyrhizobium]
MNRRQILLGASGALTAAAVGAGAWRSATGTMSAYDDYSARLRAPLSAEVADVIRYATLAANGHNTQPWRFAVAADAITITPDLSRRTAVVDPDDHHLYVSLGCAAANLAIAAAASGRPGEVIIDGPMVRYSFTGGRRDDVDPLLSAIVRRQSTRGDYDGREVPPRDLSSLQVASAVAGVDLAIITAPAAIAAIRDLVIAGNSAQMRDAAFMRELKDWIRFNPRSAMASGDGLFAGASGNPSLPTALGGIAFDRLFDASAENDKYASRIASSAGIAVFAAEQADAAHWIRVGQAAQRFALEATRLGLKLAFINQPVEVAALRPELARLIGTTRRPDLVLRFGYGPALPFSPRRPIGSVLSS